MPDAPPQPASQPDPIPKGYDAQLFRIRHSAAHVLAQAVVERFRPEGPVSMAAGPPVENGFYYDFQLPRPPSDEDLAWVEQRMKDIIRGKHPFRPREVTIDEARSLFGDQPLKLEILEGIVSGGFDEDGNPIGREGPPPRLTVYEHDTFVDLCKGPHVASTADIDPESVKVTHIAGAYFRGDERRPMLQRIYGTAWKSAADLEHYLWQRAEAEKRDHRRLGKELELFHMDPGAPGMPYWLPKGQKILNELLSFWRVEHERRDYQEISTPLINDKKLWETSGHWEHYRENMFLVPMGPAAGGGEQERVLGVKPMNCPNAMVVFNLRRRSYRELPLRLSDCDILHRNERSGALHGLLRVQKFQQDDAHIFIPESEIEAEYRRIFEIAKRFYSIFDMKYSFRLGTRPEKFVGDVETWNEAEAALRRILEAECGPGGYAIEEGDGAFYGPKVDILMEDALGRSWQMGTIQLDFQLPRRFGCTYVDKDGTDKTPVVVHRVIYGSMERFIGLLIEHCAGAFPVWLSPIQARIVPITDKQLDFCREILGPMRDQGLRVDLDDSSERMNVKIRNAQLEKIPYMLVVGKREVEAGAVAVRLRTGEDLGAMPVSSFVDRLRGVIAEKKGL